MKTNSYSTIYEKLGITPVINAWGVATELGGWTLSPKVSKAMEDASICGLGQAAPNPIRSVVKYFSEEIS